MIYHVNSNVEMKGFRCYFVAEETVSGSGAKLFSGARLMHSDGTSTELRLIKAEPTGDADAVYDLLGRKSNGQRNGVVIKNGDPSHRSLMFRPLSAFDSLLP